MTPAEQAREADLRADAMCDPDAASVIADFYEERGQPSRAKMWRKDVVRIIPADDTDTPQTSRLPPDLAAVSRVSAWCKVDPRRNLMMWVLNNVVSQAEVARLFDLSPERVRQILYKQWRQIAYLIMREARHPTMAATARLVDAGALRPTTAADDAYAGMQPEVPPDTWPATSKAEIKRMKERLDEP